MSHVHEWKTSKYLLLSLPDIDGFADRFSQWRCTTCPIFLEIDGNIRMGTPLHDPPFWDALDPASPTHTTREARRLVREQRR